MRTIIHNGHQIGIKGWGSEAVFYDGKKVAGGMSMVSGSYVFRVNEDGEDVQYDVTISLRWHGCSYWSEVRRRGEIIYTDR